MKISSFFSFESDYLSTICFVRQYAGIQCYHKSNDNLGYDNNGFKNGLMFALTFSEDGFKWDTVLDWLFSYTDIHVDEMIA